ncbi:MAG: hypothetical protein ACTSWY_02565 [Promethearchaeota archaeon]
MLSPKIISEITEKKIELTNAKMNEIHNEIKLIPKYDLKEVSERLYDTIIENANHKLKNNALGQIIFHLYNIDRLATYIGVEKLIYGALVIKKDLPFEVLRNIDEETYEVGNNIKKIIEGSV